MIELSSVSGNGRLTAGEDRLSLQKPQVWVMCPEGGQLDRNGVDPWKIRISCGLGLAGVDQLSELIGRHHHANWRRRGLETCPMNGSLGLPGILWGVLDVHCNTVCS